MAGKEIGFPTSEKVGYRGEFLLDRASIRSIWNQISTSRGLSEWFAQEVDIIGDDMIVYWDKKGDDRAATITVREPNSMIKWVWKDDPESYISLEIVRAELSQTVSLLVDDHDLNMSRESLEDIWENHLYLLRSRLGLV